MVATVQGWEDYAEARGETVTVGANANAALVRAQDYIDHTYANRLIGTAPEALLDAAVYEAATLELATPGFFSQTYTPDQRKVLTEVEGIKWTVVGGSGGAMPVSTKIEAMLSPYLRRKGMVAFGASARA